MGDKYVATVRFHMEGVEAELYGRLMEGKKEAGTSIESPKNSPVR